MRSSKSTPVTFGVALVLIGVVAWLLLGDDRLPQPDSPAKAKASRAPHASERRSPPDRARERGDDDGEDRSLPRPRRFGERPDTEPETDDDGERALFESKIEAFHRWRIDSRRQLMTCLPHPGAEAQPHELRVVFEPLVDAPPDAPRRLMVARFEPGPGLEDADALVIPQEVQTCLDQLIGSPLELPEGSPELEEGYQESIEIPWS